MRAHRFEAETNGDYLRILDVSLEAISPVEPEGDDLAAAAEALEGDEDVDEDTLYRGPVCTLHVSHQIECITLLSSTYIYI